MLHCIIVCIITPPAWLSSKHTTPPEPPHEVSLRRPLSRRTQSASWTYFICERPHTERSSWVLVVASWEVVAGLQCLEAGGGQAEAAGRRRSRVLPLLGHRCVLTVERLEGGWRCCQVIWGYQQPKHIPISAVRHKINIWFIRGGGEGGGRQDLSPIITSYLLDCIDHARGGCCLLRKHGSYCCGYRRHERQIWTPSAVNRRLPLRLGWWDSSSPPHGCEKTQSSAQRGAAHRQLQRLLSRLVLRFQGGRALNTQHKNTNKKAPRHSSLSGPRWHIFVYNTTTALTPPKVPQRPVKSRRTTPSSESCSGGAHAIPWQQQHRAGSTDAFIGYVRWMCVHV